MSLPSTHLEFSVDVNIDIIEESQIQLLANDILLVLLEMNKAAVVCLLQGPQEVIRDVIPVVLRGPDRNLLSIFLDRITPIVLFHFFLTRKPGEEGR